MNQENIDQARKSKRGRTFSILGSILKKTSTVSGSGGDSATNKDSAATMSQSPSRTFAPKVFNFVKHGRGKQRILETMDQNTIAIDMTPDAEELEDIDDEELFKDNATIIPIPYVDQEESLGLFSPPTPKSNAQPNAVTVVDSGLRDDSSLSLELKYGPYYEVWDPREKQVQSFFSYISCRFLPYFIQ